jgi:hypothetical protein
MLGRISLAAGILASTGTLAILILTRLNRPSKKATVPAGKITSIDLCCPRCRAMITLPLGQSACPHCRLLVSLAIELPEVDDQAEVAQLSDAGQPAEVTEQRQEIDPRQPSEPSKTAERERAE